MHAGSAILTTLPVDVLVLITSLLPTPEDLARLSCTCDAFNRSVEAALRLRASKAGYPAELPAGESSWTQLLLWVERLHRAAPPLPIAVGFLHTAFAAADGE